MKYTPEPWAKEWLDKKRKNGEKCLEVKVSNGNHYVYRSTSKYDPDTKGPKKVSEYMGVLDPERGFTEKAKDNRKQERAVSIRETGTMRLLEACSGDLFSILKNRFPENYDQLYALASMRSIGRTPLNRASSYWEMFENYKHLRPVMSPRALSKMMRDVGSNEGAQNQVFHDLNMNCGELALDLTEFFSESGKISFTEGGYSAEHNDFPQINIALICTKDSGIPVMMKMIPESARDIWAACSTIKEMGRRDVKIVAVHSHYSKENINVLDSSGMDYIMPVKRNSLVYKNTKVDENNFFEYHERLIRFGKNRYDHHWAYRFRDETSRLGEEQYAFMRYKDGGLTMEEVDEQKSRMGQNIIISNMDLPPEDVYLMFKRRDSAEKLFKSYKSVLDADSVYLQDTVTAFGHVFVSFLSMYMIANLEDRLRKTGLISKMSTDDVLMEYSKAYAVELESGVVDYVIPKKLEALDAELGMNIFPILRS